MAYDKFLVAPLSSGMQTNVKPFLISDDAYTVLNNAYNWRSRIRKRFGTRYINGAVEASIRQLSSRVRIAVATTDINGDAAGIVPGSIRKVGQLFSIDTIIFTVNALGTPANLLQTTPITTATYDTSTGAFVFVGAPALTTVYFYPAEPIMGIFSYETGTAINDERTIVFDTQFSYEYTGAGYEQVGAPTFWAGTNSDFFSAVTWLGTTASETFLFVVNNVIANQIAYFNGVAWTLYSPAVSVITVIRQAALVTTFADRLLFIDVTERTGIVDVRYQNRIRFSKQFKSVSADAFQGANVDDQYIDLPVSEQIVGINKLRNRLIIIGERTTWELIDTQNPAAPFIWNQINTDYGCESSHSVISFDKEVLFIGETGIFSCNGTNVDRIDLAILNQVFQIQNTQNGVKRVYGIRDFTNEMVYWSYPEGGRDSNFYPDKVLVYNYINKTWSINDDTFTAFGYWQNDENSTWISELKTWEDSIETWDSEEETRKNQLVIAGNQEGYVMIIDPNIPINELALQITDIPTITDDTITLKIIDHNFEGNLEEGDFIYIDFAQGTSTLENINETIYEINVIDGNTITIPNTNGITGVYTGGGVVSTVSQIDIWTKQYNFYQKNARNMSIPMVDFNVDKTQNGLITVDYYTSFALESRATDADETGAAFGTSILETSPYSSDFAPYESNATQLWHRIYIQAEGEVIQLRLYLNADQMLDNQIRNTDFQLNAVLYYSQPTQRLQ